MHMYIYIYLYIYIYTRLILGLRAANERRCYFVTTSFTDKLSLTRRGLNSRPPDWGNTASCQLSSTIASCHWNCVNKHNPDDMPEAALDNWQPVWNAHVSISTPVCVNFELRPGSGDIHFCWFNFDALAQGSALYICSYVCVWCICLRQVIH